MRRATRRIGLQTGAAVAVAVFGLTAIAALVVLRGQHTAEDQLITTTIEQADDVTDPPAGVWLVIRDGGHVDVGPGIPAGLPDRSQLDLVSADGVARSADVVADGREYRVDTRRRSDGDVVQAVLDLSADHAERVRLLEAYLVSGAAGLVVACVVGVWLGRRAVAPLAAALALQRRFVADAGHELRTPLTLLSTRAQFAAQALGQDTDVATARSDVDRLVVDAAHLTGILDDLLLAADPRQVQVDEVVVVSELVNDAVESARLSAERHGVALVWTSEDRVPAVLGSPASLRRAMTALLDNAIRHADSSVCLTVRADDGDVVVDVRDDGPGVAPEVMVTMFNRFATSPADERLGDNRRYGLGLALVNEVAVQHNGAVSVVDTGRRGATLRLRLPAVRASRRDRRARA
ncbi:MAG TPA: HAMP domain-containing sensor histidine kinase [Pseudonocardiaceae bacterium]